MPVLSPRHSSSLSGSYRSTFSSSLTRPYYGTTSYSSPRITTTTYTERYSSKTYNTDDGTKRYSRHSSIQDDTSRYRDDTREKSLLRRDSSGFNGSTTRLRESSIGEQREHSLSRESSSRNYSSTLSMIDSVADLRSKYSPSNYVPAVLRKQDIARSKSINDIGRPPTTTTTVEKSTKKVITNLTNNASSVALTNNTNKEKLDNTYQMSDDTNGNNNRSSVAEIRKKFDPNPNFVRKQHNNGLVVDVTPKTCNKNETNTNNEPVKTTTTTTTNIHKSELLGGNSKCYNRPAKCFKINLDIQETDPTPPKTTTTIDDNDDDADATSETWIDDSKMDSVDIPRPHNHTTNFASYIPNKEFFEDSLKPENNDSTVAAAPATQNRIITTNNDITTTSPRLPRSSISQNSTIPANTLNSSNPNNRTSPTSNRPSPTINRSSPTPALDGIRARTLATNDDIDGLTGRYERGGSNVRSQGLNGLKNIGNTCFMNSVIQCLSNTKYLLEYVREEGYQSDINTSISSMKGALFKAFSQVIQELWSPDSADKVVNTVALKSQIQRFAPRFMGYAQQDAQEFLRYLLEGLHEDVNRVVSKPKPILTEIDETLSDSQKASEAWSRYLRMDNSRVVDTFVGQLKSTLRCTHCGHCSVTFDPFWDLSLPIPQRQGPLRLGQLLEHFTREETLDGDEKPTCSKCKERRKCTKSFCIQKFPKILVIHIKRFSPTERFRGKLSLVIDFPLQGLDLSAFAASKSQTESMYNLYAISNHSGTTYSGHYTAYCKHPYSGQWHEYNDSRVSTISAKNVVSSEAYVLFYELVGQNSHL